MQLIPRLAAGFVIAMAGSAQPASRPPDIVLANDRLELTILGTGGSFSKLLLRDGEPVSPLAAIGHFLALDGFGAPSDQERAAGMPFHGEASKQVVKVIASQEFRIRALGHPANRASAGARDAHANHRDGGG
jgi:hypothetical protein